MAIGKNKRKKGGRKKVIDPMKKKEWYVIEVPKIFGKTRVGHTLVNRTAGLKLASDGLKGRVVEVSLADLKDNEDHSHRKIKFIFEEIQGNKILTNFHGMDLTRNKICSLVKKWHTLIEAWVDVRTTDGYVLRLFCIGFTKRRRSQVAKTSYAQASQIRKIREKMVNIIKEEEKNDLKEICKRLMTGSIARDIEKKAAGTYPMQDVFIRKAKVLRKPKFDLARLLEFHAGSSEDTGVAVDSGEGDELVPELPGTGGRL